MDPHKLRCFLAVARCGHFGRAAQELHLTASPVSRAIKELERGVGGQLFVRRHHHVELTAAGRHLLARLPSIVDDLAALSAEVRCLALSQGHPLRIGVTPWAAETAAEAVLEVAAQVDPLLADVVHTSSRELCTAVTNGDLDLALVHLDLGGRAGEELGDTGLSRHTIVSYMMQAVFRSDDPLAGRHDLCLADLADHTYVMLINESQSDALEERRASVAAHGIVSIETVGLNDFMLCALKVRRCGSFTIIPRESGLGDFFAGSRYARVLVRDHPCLGLGLVWRAGERRDPRVEAIVSSMRERTPTGASS